MSEPASMNTSRDNVTTIVTLVSLIFFVAIGAPVVSQAVQGLFGQQPSPNSVGVIAVLLNIALILIGWRRSKGLMLERLARDDAEKRADEAAYHDFLTGLLNRRGFTARLEAELQTGQKLALALLDLDHFKRVNDAYGHNAGDAVLKNVADLLGRLAPIGASVGRLGGDEFAILFGGRQATHEGATAVAEEIVTALKAPIALGSVEAQIGVSIGLACSEAANDCATDFLRRSDMAMYEAKKLGRNQHAWFERSLEEELQSRQKLEAEIRTGIAAGQFVPFYQPQINLVTKELHGLEVLARWNHPELGVVEPQSFIPVAEATGLIGSLSLCVMQQALLETAAWDQKLMIAVNLSPIQLKDPLLAQRIMKILSETGFPANRLELEITESSLFDDLELALSTIQSLKNLGVTISLDDFGTGYSSLTQLQALPFDRIKIDRSFVLSMTDNEESAAIVGAIASLAESLNLPVTAEGVETEVLQKALEALGCSEGQGWHFGRPMTAQDIKEVLDVANLTADVSLALPANSAPKVPESPVHERRDQGRRGSGRRAA